MSSTRFRSVRHLPTLQSALACCCLLWASTLRAQYEPWSAPGELALGKAVQSVQVAHQDEALYQGPSTADARRGSAALGARLPVFGARRGPGCRGRFLLVGALAWLCEDGAELSAEAPDGEQNPALPRSRDGLPYRYHFVGPDGSFGYRALETAEDGVPDTQLLKGFGVALERVESNARGNAFGRTSEGVWLPMRDLIPVAPPPLRGRELEQGLNVAWVVTKGALGSHAPGAAKDTSLVLAKFQQLDILEQREFRGRRWYRYAQDAWLSDHDARTPRSAELPRGIRAGERWIDVDVQQQVLTAYIGARATFAALVSTGRGAEGSVLATPRGEHRMWVKLRTSNMDNLDQEAAAENYAIQAVPWVMYFERGYGLHGTFWHRDFGNKHSHGCVNLSPRDAERLFAWTSPKLPPGWTAALPTPYEPGTLVRVR